MASRRIGGTRSRSVSFLAAAAILLGSCTELPTSPPLRAVPGGQAALVGNSMADATVIVGESGMTEWFSLDAGQSAWFRWTAPAPGFYRFSTCAVTTDDTVLELYDASGTLVESNDDSVCPGAGFVMLQSTVIRWFGAGTYFLRVMGYQGRPVAIAALAWTRAGTSWQTAVPLSGPAGLSSAVLRAGESMWYRLQSSAGPYVISTCAAEGGSADFDTMLRVHGISSSGAENGLIAQNDDACGGLQSRIETYLHGPAFIEVTGYQGRGGTFSLAWRALVRDEIPPAVSVSISPAPNANGWNNTPVTLTVASSDNPGGSGVTRAWCEYDDPSDGSPRTLSFPAPISSAELWVSGRYRFRCATTDGHGNRSPVVLQIVHIDRAPPTIRLWLPADTRYSNASWYYQGSEVTPSYEVYDGVSGVTCTNSGIDTDRIGTHVFTITCTDDAGNSSSITTAYEVRPRPVEFRICRYDQPHAAQGGSVVPMKIAVCRQDGSDASSTDRDVRVVRIDLASGGTAAPTAAGKANPNGAFRYDPALPGYIFNLNTKGLPSGTHWLVVAIEGQSGETRLQFQLK